MNDIKFIKSDEVNLNIIHQQKEINYSKIYASVVVKFTIHTIFTVTAVKK